MGTRVAERGDRGSPTAFCAAHHEGSSCASPPLCHHPIPQQIPGPFIGKPAASIGTAAAPGEPQGRRAMGSSVPPAAALGFVFPHAVLSCPCCCFDPRLASVGIFRLFFWPPLALQHITCEVAGALQAGGCALHPPVLAGTCKRAGGCADLPPPPPLPPPHVAQLSQPRGRERLIQQLLPPNLTLTSKRSPLPAHPGNPQPQISTRWWGSWVWGQHPGGTEGSALLLRVVAGEVGSPGPLRAPIPTPAPSGTGAGLLEARAPRV